MTLAKGISYDDLDFDALWDRAVYFWSKVDRLGSDECWIWTGYRMYAGYGEMAFLGRKIGAHRFSYLLHSGPLGDGKCICHKCCNRLCVNPRHLYQGTYRDNWLDMSRPAPSPGGYDEEFWGLVFGDVGEVLPNLPVTDFWDEPDDEVEAFVHALEGGLDDNSRWC